uniref:Uncharacterized protein n=1 Tax=Panagrolaimus sp. ES5 TaxID=591445 RepID=A0AC34GGF2_9BILA
MSTEAIETNVESLSIEEDSSPSFIISSIKKKHENNPAMFINQNECKESATFLHKYKTICDHSSNTLYIEAEVRFESLNTGSGPNETIVKVFEKYKAPGDIPAQYIAKKLGGDGYHRNLFVMNPQVDLTELDNAQNLVYSHVEKGENRYAKMFFGITYEDPNAEEGKYFWR